MFDSIVPHRPLYPNCNPVGMLWPSGDWVSRAAHSQRRLVAEATHAQTNVSRVLVCSAHKAGHTLGQAIAGDLRPYLPRSEFKEVCTSADLAAACAQAGLVIVIERDIYEMIGSGVLYHASGTEPWTRCRLQPCNTSGTDPSCCRACGECIAGPRGCNCGHFSPSCAGFIAGGTGRIGAALRGLPTGSEVFYASRGYQPRVLFASLAQLMRKRYPGGQLAQEHLHLLYRRGLAAESWEPTVAWADRPALTAAVATETLRYLLTALPEIEPLHAHLGSPCSLRLCLSQFTNQFPDTAELILKRAGVSTNRWPAALAALSQEDISSHPSGHSTNRVVPSAARAEVEAEARRIDDELLGGLLGRQSYGSGCASKPAEAGSNASPQ